MVVYKTVSFKEEVLVIGNLRCLSHDDSQAQFDALPPIEASALG